MSEPVRIFATIRPKPEFFDEAKAAILEIIPVTRAEPGCEWFDLYEGAEGSGTLHLWEKFASDAALEAHYAKDYTRQVFDAYQEWLAQPVEVQRLSPLETAGSGDAK